MATSIRDNIQSGGQPLYMPGPTQSYNSPQFVFPQTSVIPIDTRSIEAFVSLQTPAPYAGACAVLIHRFGDKYKVAEAYRNELNKWPPIKANDAEGLQIVCSFLEYCKATMMVFSHFHSLDNREEIQKIVMKLPRSCAGRWSIKVAQSVYPGDGEIGCL